MNLIRYPLQKTSSKGNMSNSHFQKMNRQSSLTTFARVLKKFSPISMIFGEALTINKKIFGKVLKSLLRIKKDLDEAPINITQKIKTLESTQQIIFIFLLLKS